MFSASRPVRSYSRKLLLPLLTLATLARLAGAGEARAQPGSSTRINDYGVYQEPPLPALPPAGGTLRDLSFGTQIMRVTDERDGASNGTYYSQWPTLNADSTRML